MQEEKFQQLAIDLAKKAIGKVSPRPAVGAVLVLNGKVIGEGKTNISPGDHAEVEAIKNASDKINATRPTAVNLSWALNKIMTNIVDINKDQLPSKILELANQIRQDDINNCKSIGLRIINNFIIPSFKEFFTSAPSMVYVWIPNCMDFK